MDLRNSFLFCLMLMATGVTLIVSDDPESEKDSCPASNEVYPCTCKMDYDGSCIIMCYAVGASALDKLAKIPNLCNGNVEFSLIHSTARGIPGKLWETLLSSEMVDVTIKYSTLEYLVPPEYGQLPALYSPKSAALKITHAGNVEKWQWEQLSNFKCAEGLTLVIDDTPMKALDKSFSRIANGFVTKLTIDMTGLAELPDEIFKSFTLMHSLSIQNNNLKEIKRSAIPRPAPELKFLALNGNALTSLPDDFFADMPILETVYLRDNMLTTLPANIFKSMNSKSVRLMDFINNPWNCDCHLLEVEQSSLLRKYMGKCASPNNVKGKDFQKARDLVEC